MPNNCEELQRWLNNLPIFYFPFDETNIPLNGLYVLFEKGERAHGVRRIVRVGTHTGKNQLRSRMKQHFLAENKDRSIFRKNIGRCILSKARDPFLEEWELDLTSKSARNKHSELINLSKQKVVEREVSSYMQANFSFVVVQIEEKKERLEFESKIISTVSLCDMCGPSKNWLGSYSPKNKIRESGLWLVNELHKEPLCEKDFGRLREFAEKGQVHQWCVTRAKEFGCELYIPDDKELFDFLLAKKDDIERELGIKLDWQRLPEETKASRIKIAKKFDIVGNTDFSKYGEAFTWLENNVDNFKKVLSKHLADYK